MASYRLYVTIWVLLVAATLMEVVTRFLPAGISLLITGIITIATAKAILIALYFQHLRYETKMLAVLPIAGFLVLSTLLIVSIISGA